MVGSQFYSYLLAMVSGILLALSNAPFDYAFLEWVALAPLFAALRGKGWKASMAMAVSTGTVLAAACYHGATAYSPLFFLGILGIFSLNFAFFGVMFTVVTKKFRSGFFQVFVPAVVWMAIEQLNTNTVVGLPLNLSLAQSIYPRVIQSASIGGIFAVSFLVVLANSAIAYILYIFQEQKTKGVTWSQLAAPMLAFVVLGMNIVYGTWMIHKTFEPANFIKVATVQPVIESHIYQDSWIRQENRKLLKERFNDLTRQAADRDAQMIFWPEGGNGFYNMRIPELRNKIYRIAKENHFDFILGSRDIDEKGELFNSIFSVSSKGSFAGRYDKNHLVPFAEDVYTSGKEYRLLATSYGLMAPAICFESTFPSVLRKGTKLGAQFLVVSSSDARTGRTVLALNHARLSIFRAVENRRYLVRAAATGPSMIVDPYGRVIKQSVFYEKGVMTGEIAIMSELTPFTRYGFFIPWVAVLFTVVLSGYLFATRGKTERGSIASAVSKKRVRKKRKEYEVAQNPWTIGRALPAVSNAIRYLGFHTAVMIVIITISLVKMNLSTESRLTFSQTLRDFFAPAYEQKPENVTELFIQAKSNTCGPAALAYLLSFYGQETTEEDVLQYVTLQEKGTSMLDLRNAAISLGFQAYGKKMNFEALKSKPLPIMAFINNDHYVVISHITPTQIQMFDPAIGFIAVPIHIFKRAWDGHILVIRVNSIKRCSDEFLNIVAPEKYELTNGKA